MFCSLISFISVYGILMEYHFERVKSTLQISISFLWFSFFFFFSNRNTAKIFEIFQIPQCFVFHIFYLVIENIFKRELKREKTDKNLKIDLANLYQNQIFQGTYTHIFTFILFIQHIDLSYRAARLSSMHIQTIETIKSFSGNSNSIIIRETYLEIFLPKKKKREILSSRYLPIGRTFV